MNYVVSCPSVSLGELWTCLDWIIHERIVASCSLEDYQDQLAKRDRRDHPRWGSPEWYTFRPVQPLRLVASAGRRDSWL